MLICNRIAAQSAALNLIVIKLERMSNNYQILEMVQEISPVVEGGAMRDRKIERVFVFIVCSVDARR